MGLSKDSIVSLTDTNPSVNNVTKPEPKHKMKNVKETEKQTSKDARIPTSAGRTIAVKNLRPGDWLGWLAKDRKGEFTGRDLVVRNANSTIDTVWGGLSTHYPYEYLQSSTLNFVYLGRGKKRKWLDKLPKWIANQICPYSGPAK